VNRFLERYKTVKVKTSRPLNQDRHRGSTKETYKAFFNRFKYQIDSKNVSPKYISNVDEYGI
ncbi:hypothetical protein B0T16DRAFT_337290, partial [Cercophora newfieldiana]